MKQFLKPSLLSLALFSSYASANIPEPDVVFYGKITSQVGATKVSLTEGTLNWEVRPKEGEGKTFTFTTPLESISAGQYSYKISIPQEYLVAVETLESEQSNTMTTESAKDLLLQHYQISVNGQPALLTDDKLAFFTVNEANRSNHLRVDLTVSDKAIGSLDDANGNGLPDIWETHYGLSGSAQDDPDGDGWSNEEEYAKGSDPNKNNKLPQLAGDKGVGEAIEVRMYENGLSQLRLNILDSDSELSEIFLSVDQLPEGVELYHADNLGQPIQVADDYISALDVKEGKIFSKYSPASLLDSNGLAVDPSLLMLTLFDEGPLHYEVTDEDAEGEASNEGISQSIKISVFRPSNVADPVRWVDGVLYKDESVEVLVGRSGSALDRLLAYNHDGSRFSPTGAAISVNSDGLVQTDPDLNMFAFEEPDNVEQRVDLNGNRSIFAVYESAEVPYENIFFNDGNVQWADTFGYANFGQTSSKARVQSTKTNHPGINVAAVHTSAYMNSVELNGKPVGGPKLHSGETLESSSLAGFGFALGSYGTNPGVVYPFEGSIGEFIAFPGTLEGTDKWLVNAYLLGKWKGFTIYDASRATTPTTLSVSTDTTSPALLLGGVEDDTLIAGGVESILVGGSGADILVGGPGSDHFVIGDGDTIKGFTEYSSLEVKDVLDISGLLDVSDAVLDQCVYFKPVENNTLVKINRTCSGEDKVSGTDFTDAQFRIEGQGLWNTDVPVLWRSGALYAGNHKPGHIVAALQVNGGQTLTINENNESGDSKYKVSWVYSGGQPFEGTNLELPLQISGSAEPVKDYDLTLKRYIAPFDADLVSELTNGQYDYDQLVNAVSDAELSAYKFEKGLDEDGETVLYNHYSVLDESQSAGTVVYIPSKLSEDTPESKKIELTLHVKNDGIKEAGETIKLSLKSVPEYYDLEPEKSQVEIVITDGLDRVYASAPQSRIYEGEVAEILLHREGTIDTPLTVNVALSGLASNGEDYAVVSSQFTFAKGEKTGVISINSLSDSISEQIEQIELKVLASPLYEVDLNRNLAQLFIHDKALNFVDTDNDGLPDTWELAMGLSPTVSNQSNGGYKDSDGDGLSDFEEYQRGTDPKKADSDGDLINDGKDMQPLDPDTSDEASNKGYQVVQVGRESEINVPTGLDRVIEVPLHYLTTDGRDQSNGLQMVLQYNADQLEFLGIADVLKSSHASTGDPSPRDVYRGGYKLFSHEVSIAWDASGNDWPSMPLPTSLLKARFKLQTGAVPGEKFMIGVDAQQAGDGYAFKPGYLAVNVVAPSGLDILVDEDVPEEAIMLARHYAGLSPESEEVNQAKLSEPEINRITQHVAQAGLQYDVDGDGEVNPLSDSVLIYHYLKTGSLSSEIVTSTIGDVSSEVILAIEARIKALLQGAQ